MRIIDIKEATAPLSEYLSAVAVEPVIITVQGKPFAALTDIEETDFETVSLSMNAEFMEIIEHSRKRHKQEGGISGEEMRRRMGLAE